jgi:hypothetical protein
MSSPGCRSYLWNSNFSIPIVSSSSPAYLFVFDHLAVSDYVLSRIEDGKHPEVRNILLNPKLTFNQKRGALLQCGLPRALVDEIEVFSTSGVNDASHSPLNI